MAFETEGVLYKVFDTENKTATFQAREFVIKSEGEYPQFIKFQLTQDRCDLISDYQEGQQIKVHFDLRGREWNEKFLSENEPPDNCAMFQFYTICNHMYADISKLNLKSMNVHIYYCYKFVFNACQFTFKNNATVYLYSLNFEC